MPARDDLQQIDLADFTKGISANYHSQINDTPAADGDAEASETYGCYGLQTGGLAPLPKALSGAWSHFDLPFLPLASEPEPDPEDPWEPGHLGPGPIVPPVTPPDLNGAWVWPTVADGYPDGYDQRIAILDAKALSPIVYSPELTAEVDHSDPPVDIYVVRQWWIANPEDSRVDTRWRLSGRSVYLNSNGQYGQEFTDVSARASMPTWNPHGSRWGWGWGSITETRTKHPSPPYGEQFYTTGFPVIVWSAGTVINHSPGLDAGGIWTFPDASVADTVSDTIKRLPDLWGSRFSGILFGHQSRLCAITRESGAPNFRKLAWHPNTSQRGPNDTLLYWPPNNVYTTGFYPAQQFSSPPLIDWSVESQDTIQTLASYGISQGNVTSKIAGVSTFAPLEESVSGFGVWSSVDANSLFLVKNQGGAVMLNGDLDRPTVQRLPGVPSVGGVANRGANTESGFVYGTTSGVWMWSGGNTATNIAPQLNPTFWIPEDPTVTPPDSTTPGRQLGQLIGSFGYRWPYVYTPNNWVMDLRTGGWWRYWPTVAQDPDNGVSFAFNEVDSEGNLWAFPASHLDGSALTVDPDNPESLYQENDYLIYRQFDLETPSNYWQWKSQPLTRTRSRYLDFRSITIVGAGVGRITVTLYGLDGETEEVHVDFQSNERAQAIRNIGIKGTDIQVKISSRAALETDEAPTLHRISLGYKELQTVKGN